MSDKKTPHTLVFLCMVLFLDAMGVGLIYFWIIMGSLSGFAFPAMQAMMTKYAPITQILRAMDDKRYQ